MDIDKLINELKAKRDELCGYVNAQRGNMDYGVVGLPRQRQRQSVFSKLLWKLRNRTPLYEQPDYDYSLLSRRISQRVRELHTHVSDAWVDFVSSQQVALKQQISLAQIDDEAKRKMIDLAVRHSVINCSMLDMLSGLSKTDRSIDGHTPKDQAIDAYRRYYEDFIDDYKRLIDEAWREQKKRYEIIIELNKK